MKSESGIYKIVNVLNNHVYVGSATNLTWRRTSHLSCLRKGKHGNPHLQNAYNLYGENSFSFSVIEYCEKEELIEREQFHIDSSRNQGLILYNVCPMAGSSLGRKHSEETRKKISAIVKGRIAWNKGEHGVYSEETIARMSKSLMGRKAWNKDKAMSEETKKKLSVLNMGHIPINKGSHLTDEAKRKLSESCKGQIPWNKGVPCSEEIKKRLSLAKKGKPSWNKGLCGIYSDETIQKMSQRKKGKSLSEEHKASISRGIQQYLVNKKMVA